MKIVWTILSLAKHAIKLQINKHKQVVGISYFAGKYLKSKVKLKF